MITTQIIIFFISILRDIIKVIIFIIQIIIFLIWTLWIIISRTQFGVGRGCVRIQLEVVIGNQAFCQDPSVKWHSGLPRARAGPPMHHVALSLPRARVGQPKHQLSLRGQRQCQVPTPHAAPSKLVLIIFSSTILLMPNAPQWKRKPHPSSAVIATLCVKSWAVITLLQFTVLCVYINSNRGTEPF